MGTARFVAGLANILIQIEQDKWDVIEALLVGDLDTAALISAPYIVGLQAAVELLQALFTHVAYASVEEKGYYAGRATFEIASLAVAELKLTQLSKAAFLTKLAETPLFSSTNRLLKNSPDLGIARTESRPDQLHLPSERGRSDPEGASDPGG